MTWKEQLLKAREKYMLAKYAGCRDFGVPFPKPYSDKTKNELIRCVYDFLKFNGHQVNKINPQGQCRLEKIQLANEGTANIHAVISGKSVYIEVECKATCDRLRPEQLKEKLRIETSGGLYIIVTNMEGFINSYEQSFPISTLQTK
ncbi:hypothetical protein [Parafilimonas terrae]|uniref:Uncharacterized protein n=1 Tax=Parafilimonas terrae TaxID=1465490 RepID=A0A1I5UAN9_9BACT|nr:hypothetical protein [Parafilimonas terrae]SFP92374.1 hypothetical protein SAMN05444277_103175 [Parafilimonas terrae]